MINSLIYIFQCSSQTEKNFASIFYFLIYLISFYKMVTKKLVIEQIFFHHPLSGQISCSFALWHTHIRILRMNTSMRNLLMVSTYLIKTLPRRITNVKNSTDVQINVRIMRLLKETEAPSLDPSFFVSCFWIFQIFCFPLLFFAFIILVKPIAAVALHIRCFIFWHPAPRSLFVFGSL